LISRSIRLQNAEVWQLEKSEKAVFVHSIMDLPEDVVFIILRKLASQDPLALLEAACVCKSFYAVTTQHPGLWKVAFYGAVLPLNEKPRDKALEEEVESFGEFKKLVKARWGKRGYSGSLFNGKDPHIGKPRSKSDSLILLTLLRTFDGRLLLWGAQEAFKNSLDMPKSIIDGLPLCPVTMTKSSDLAEICQPYFINGPAVAPVPHAPPDLELYVRVKAEDRAKMAPLFRERVLPLSEPDADFMQQCHTLLFSGQSEAGCPFQKYWPSPIFPVLQRAFGNLQKVILLPKVRFSVNPTASIRAPNSYCTGTALEDGRPELILEGWEMAMEVHCRFPDNFIHPSVAIDLFRDHFIRSLEWK
jgi:hypothetical protein